MRLGNLLNLFRRQPSRPLALMAERAKVCDCPVCRQCGAVRIRFEGIDFATQEDDARTVWLSASLVRDLADELMARSIAHAVIHGERE